MMKIIRSHISRGSRFTSSVAKKEFVSFISRGKLLILGHGFKTDSRSGARDAGRLGPCRTGHRVVGSGGRLQRPAGVEYYHVDYVGLRKRFYSRTAR